MDKALQVFSRQGNFKTLILAKDIKGKEHARKLSPFVDPESTNELVSWVSPCFENARLKRRSHFRKRNRISTIKPDINSEEEARRTTIYESPEHKQAKTVLINELNFRLEHGIPLEWGFYDSNASDLPIIGNLLCGASTIDEEYIFKSPLNNMFRLDIAILGDGIRNKNKKFIYAGIEIEKDNTFDYRKEILCKSAAFPLISIDISNLSLIEINADWAKKVISETLKTSESKRSNYFYLHDLLYPLFIKHPEKLLKYEPDHQFIVFDNTDNLDKIRDYCNQLAKNIDNYKIHVQRIHIYKKDMSINENEFKKYQNLVDIVGQDSKKINPDSVLLITTERPKVNNQFDFIIHMALFRILLSSPSAMIGYRFAKYEYNNEPNEDLWHYKNYDREKDQTIIIKIAPKRLSVPLQDIIHIINTLK